MTEQPLYVRMPTENEHPYFAARSCAEAMMNVVIDAQSSGWLRLHGFAILPEAVEMVITPLKQNVRGVIAHLQAQSIPLLAVLIPHAAEVWGRHSVIKGLESQRALDARLEMLNLMPVACGITDESTHYAYSSVNPRYAGIVTRYAGFQLSVMRITPPNPIPAVTAPIPQPEA
jgi:hypothetical protein